MNTFRHFNRNLYVEIILLSAVLIQIISGLTLFRESRKTANSNFKKLHIWSGLYLAFFLVIHFTAILAGRFYFNLNTNLYFGVAGLNSFPLNLFFIPYYGLAIIFFFGHIAAIHSKKFKLNIFGLTPTAQAKSIFVVGCCVALIIIYGLTNHFKGFQIPEQYKVLVGKYGRLIIS